MLFVLLVSAIAACTGSYPERSGSPGWSARYPTVVHADQGSRADGEPVLAQRSVPEHAIRADSEDGDRFFSLGFGGSLDVTFNVPVENRPGPDLQIIEVTGSRGYPREQADVFAIVEERTYFLGSISNRNPVVGTRRLRLNTLDLDRAQAPDGQTVSLDRVSTIRIVDTSNRRDFELRPDADGFDIDGIESITPAPGR